MRGIFPILLSFILVLGMITMTGHVFAKGMDNFGNEENGVKLLELLNDIKSDLNEELPPGLYKREVKPKKNKKLEQFTKILEKNPELIKKSKAFQTFYNDAEFNKIFNDVIVTAGVGETDTASYVFDDGSIIEASLSTKMANDSSNTENSSDLVSINSVTTEPSSSAYISTYQVTLSWLWYENVRTLTEAKWHNGLSYATVEWDNAYMDISVGSGSASSYTREDNANPSVVRGQFELSDPLGTSTVTKITELNLYPGSIPLATGDVIR